MRFMAPHGPMARAWRAVVLRMAPHSAWFRRRVNSGRLAEPARYPASGQSTDGALARHGSVAPDVALPDGGRLRDRIGAGFAIVAPRRLATSVPPIMVGESAAYGSSRAWLVRPDGYVLDSRPRDRAGELDGLVPGPVPPNA
jgi:hypothetical protein